MRMSVPERLRRNRSPGFCSKGSRPPQSLCSMRSHGPRSPPSPGAATSRCAKSAGAGGAHRLMFYGFALLFIGTSIITLQVDVSDALFGWKFWYGDFYLVFSLVLDVAGVALIAGLIYMMVRRGWIRPPKLDYARPDRQPGDPDADRSFYRREDWAFLWTLITIAVTGYVLEAARLIWLQDRPGVWSTPLWSPVRPLPAQPPKRR